MEAIRTSILAGLAALFVALAATAQAADWTPKAWADESTIQLMTTAPGQDPHWFPVWLVVIDDQLYVRLGSRAADRMQSNTAAPYIKVKIAGQQFDRVKVEEVRDKVEAVAQAMGKKYTMDLLVRLFPHPMTLRLTAE